MYEKIAILGAFIFFYSAISGGVEKTPVNGALVFTAFGLIMGPLALGFLPMEITHEGLGTLAEITLALVLFTDASNANLAVLKKNVKIPRRLLLLGLPLTLFLGFGAGTLLFSEMSWLEIAIIATMLAPTDAALGKAVVTNNLVPERIREGLNAESGLNDGICVPILFLFLALVSRAGAEDGATVLALELVAEEVGIGMAVGLGLTMLAVMILKFCVRRDWVTETWMQLPVVSLALTCFAVAQALGGSGFIACFIGGLLFGSLAKKHKEEFLLAAEGTGDTLGIITWVVFGGAVVGQSIDAFTWQVVLYSILSLTVVRMLPVFLVLTGLKMRTDEKLFIAWFGLRGLASIVFAVIVLEKELPHAHTISMTVVCTIILSILGHGLSANPLVNKLSARLKSSQPG